MTEEIIKKEEKRMQCDNCDKIMDYYTIALDFGYGSDLDESTLHFCSNKCFHEWVDKNMNKKKEK